MNLYNVEITDTFAGVANYSWVRRYDVKAKSFRGAMQKISREYGGYWRKTVECGDYTQWNMRNACIVAFVTVTEFCA